MAVLGSTTTICIVETQFFDTLMFWFSHELLPRSVKQIAKLLDCTSWSGVGPGLMDAATKGALQAGKPVGGFKIGKESGQWAASNFHQYLPIETYFTCR